MAQLEKFREFNALLFKAIDLGLKVVESPKDLPSLDIPNFAVQAEGWTVVVRTPLHEFHSTVSAYTRASAQRLRDAIQIGQIIPQLAYVEIIPAIIAFDMQALGRYIDLRNSEEAVFKSLNELKAQVEDFRDQITTPSCVPEPLPPIVKKKKVLRKKPAVKKPIRKRK
jgi:hypothetical protein